MLLKGRRRRLTAVVLRRALVELEDRVHFGAEDRDGLRAGEKQTKL